MRRAVLFALVLFAPAVAQDPPNPIDASLERLWTERGVAPAAISDDSEFLRRVTLDLAGEIPTPDEIRAFLKSKDPDKRTKRIDALLTSDAFLDFWSHRVTNALLGYSRDFEYLTNRRGFHEWVRKQLAEDRGWDRIASDVLTASGDARKKPEVSFLAQFLEFGEDGRKYGLKIEEMTGKIATTFLGLRLRCAQCHDHPFDRYTQEDFFGVVGFFQRTGAVAAQADAQPQGGLAVRTFRDPVGYKFEHWKGDLAPRFLDSRPPETENLRVEFTEVVVAHDQFARAFANRMWAYLFGRGLVEPYDDFSPKNRPVAPELMEDLVGVARSRNFSVRAMVRTIVTSNAYQRTSRATAGQDGALQEKFFARSRTRPLAPEQLWNAIDRATGLKNADLDWKAVRRLAGAQQAQMGERSTYEMLRGWFLGMLVRTSNPDAPANLGQYSANVQQVLYAMNAEGPIWAGIRSKGSGLLDKLLLYQDDPDVILEQLFLSTLGRLPSEKERDRCRKHQAGRGEKGYENVFWALLNTDEFIFNH